LLIARRNTQASGDALWASTRAIIPEIKVPEVISGIVTGTRLY